MLFINETIEIWKCGLPTKEFGMVIKHNASLAAKVNRALGKPYGDAKFTDSDEPQFFFNLRQIECIASVNRNMAQTLAQIFTPRVDTL